jgi:HEAT repeat protein
MRSRFLWCAIVGLISGSGALYAAEASVSDIIAALGSDEESARIEAIDRLGAMRQKAAEAVPALAALLEDNSARVRAHAAESLGEIGPPAKSAAEALIAVVTDPDKTVRREAMEAIRRIRPGSEVVLPLFVKQIEAADPAIRMSVLAALAERGREAVPDLINALKNEEAAFWACLVLSEIGPEAEAAVPALTKLLADDRPGVRREAMLALAAIGQGSCSAVPALAEQLGCEINCVTATYALGSIGELPAEIEAKIKKNARSDDPVLATVSRWALAKLHPDDEQLVRRTVRRLTGYLTGDDARLREAAANALVDLDPPPEISRPIIKRAMAEASPETVDAVMNVLAKLGEKVVPRLIEALKVEDMRFRAATIIARIGPPAKPAVPALIDALADEDSQTRNEVLFALGAVGPDAEAAVPAITKALDDPDINVRYAACYALGKIGPSAAAAKPELVENLGAADRVLAMSSGWALAQVACECEETAAKAVPVLIDALGAPDAMTRIQAADALAAFGALAKDAAPALRKAAESENEALRGAASEALEATRD